MTLTWFYADDCPLCQKVWPRLDQFVNDHQATLIQVRCPILDTDGVLQVPALLSHHDNHLYVGAFCLDALQHHLDIN